MTLSSSHNTELKNEKAAPESLEDLVKKSLALSEEVQMQNRKILRRMTMMTVASYLRLIIVVVPIVLAAIFLPPILRGYVNSLQSVLGNTAGADSAKGLQDILSQLLK